MEKYDPERWRAAFAAFMEARGINPYTWTKGTCVADNTVSNFLTGRSASLTLKSLDRLAGALHLSVSDLLRGIEEHLQGGPLYPLLRNSPDHEMVKTNNKTEENPMYEAILRVENELARLKARVRQLEREMPRDRKKADPT